jgi:hypothetical protein
LAAEFWPFAARRGLDGLPYAIASRMAIARAGMTAYAELINKTFGAG